MILDMKSLWARLSVLSVLFIDAAYADSQGDTTGSSCMLAAAKYNFGCDQTGVPDYKCLCDNRPYMGSVSYCTIEYSPDKQAEKYSVDRIGKICSQATGRLMSDLEFHIQWLNASHFIRLNMGLEPSFHQSLDSPIDIPQNSVDEYMFWKHKYRLFRKNSFIFASGPSLFIGALLFLRVLYFRAILMFPVLLKKFDTNLMRKMKRSMMVAEIGSRRRSLFFLRFHFTVQNSGIWIYQILHLILLFADKKMYLDKHVRSYLALRSGMMALAQLPIIFLLITRNNPLIYLTGISRETFFIGHKWISWSVMIDLIIHASCSVSVDFKNYYQISRISYIDWAAASISCVSLVMLLSLMPIRRSAYYIYKYLHLILVIAFVIGAWNHIHYSSARHYLSASFAIWVCDLILRFFYSVRNGVYRRGYVRVHSREVIELEFNFKQRWRYKAGTHGHIHIRKWHLLWQSTPVILLEKNTEDGRISLQAFSSATSLMSQSHWNYLKRHPHLSERIKLTFEGPYNTPRTMHLYDSIALIASSRGILSVYSYALTVKNSLDKYSKVILVWTVCSRKEIEWFQENLAYIDEDKRFEVYIFISDWCEPLFDRYEHSEIPFSSETASKDMGEQSNTNLQIRTSQPDIKWIVCQTIMRSTGNLAFMTCCSDMMRDEVRLAVAQNIQQAKIRIDCFSESLPGL